MALGADRQNVLIMILHRALLLSAIGLGAGLCFGDALGASSRGDVVRCTLLRSHGPGGCRRHIGVRRDIRGPDASPPGYPGGPHRRVEVRIEFALRQLSD